LELPIPVLNLFWGLPSGFTIFMLPPDAISVPKGLESNGNRYVKNTARVAGILKI